MLKWPNSIVSRKVVLWALSVSSIGIGGAVAFGQLNPSDDLCGRTPYCSTPVRQVDRLVNMLFGVCGAIYDQLWANQGLPVDTPLRQPTREELPMMYQADISIELKCARENNQDPDENARFDRENPREYSERVCRTYRQELYGRLLDNLPPVYVPANFPPEQADRVNELETERKQELLRRAKIFMESYRPFQQNFYQCVGGIDFLSVKLCPNVIPEADRGSETHRARVERCLDDAVSALRQTLDSAALAGGAIDQDGMPTVDWSDPSSAWGQFEQDAWWGGAAGTGRRYDHLTFEDTVQQLKNVPVQCRTARPASNGSTALQREQQEFNDRVTERADRLKEAYQRYIKSAADQWMAERTSDPNAPPPPNIAPGDASNVNVMVRIPCNSYCADD